MTRSFSRRGACSNHRLYWYNAADPPFVAIERKIFSTGSKRASVGHNLGFGKPKLAFPGLQPGFAELRFGFPKPKLGFGKPKLAFPKLQLGFAGPQFAFPKSKLGFGKGKLAFLRLQLQ